MDADKLALLLIFGVPVIGAVVTKIVKEAFATGIKMRELALREKQAQLEEKIRTDEMNAKILRMDDYGISPTEISRLTEEVRQLRDEVARLKQDVNGRTMG